MDESTGAARFFRLVIEALETSGIEYMLSGGLSASAYGRPRASIDMDIVVRASPESLKIFALRLGPEFEFDLEGGLRAARERSDCNVIDPATGMKVDLWWITDDEFDRQRFLRRRKIRFPWGTDHWASSPEDVVLHKLIWARIGGSERQIEDVSGVLAVSGETLDWDYIRKWAARLDLAGLLEKAMARAKQPET